VIKYLGSKRTLLPNIEQAIKSLGEVRSVIDLFSGTSRVGHHLKKCGYQVFSNDINTYAFQIATCYVVSDTKDHLDLQKTIGHMNTIPGKDGYFTETFCKKSQFFQPKNGAKVDAIREWIEEQNFEVEKKAILLTSLMEAADRVDSTCGIQMAYLKKWASRSFNDLQLRMPAIVSRSPFGKCSATQMDAREAAKVLSADVAYLDPPYNQHKYLGNYHIWETLVRWDHPEIYGVACKRIDVRERKSAFNQKRQILSAMRQMVEDLDVRHLVVSFNNEGYISKDEMIEILSSRGEVFVFEKEYKRYVGAQIGIHNPQGNKVGEVSHLENKEYIFIVSSNT
jgi:adenine-specific DNA-methyltransferase